MFTKNLVMVDGTVINNCENYAPKCNYIVARASDDGWWFWGGWDTEKEAEKIADEIGGRAFRYK